MAHFYADENFDFGVVQRLRVVGHDVLTVQEALHELRSAFQSGQTSSAFLAAYCTFLNQDAFLVCSFGVGLAVPAAYLGRSDLIVATSCIRSGGPTAEQSDKRSGRQREDMFASVQQPFPGLRHWLIGGSCYPDHDSERDNA